MVGHTGDIEATVVACKAADEAVKVGTNKRNYLISSFFFPFQ
jgi:bisphosphoglycerate-independent phosphoglycerate mutase (AlkP superfamily)